MASNTSIGKSRIEVYAMPAIVLSVDKGADYPLSQVQITWGLDGEGQAVAVPVIGKKILPSSGKTVEAINAKSGTLATIKIGDKNLFRGYITGSTLSASPGGANSNMSLGQSVVLSSVLSRLNAYNPIQRRFRTAGDAMSSKDREKTKISQRASATQGSLTNQPFSPETPPAEWVVKSASALLNVVEGSEGVDLVSEMITPSKSLINPDLSASGRLLSSNATQVVYKNILRWVSMPNMDVISDMSRFFFLKLMPASSDFSKFTLNPWNPLKKAPAATLTRRQIFGISRQRQLSILPITSVWITPEIGTDNDTVQAASTSATDNSPADRFYKWPKLDTDSAETSFITTMPELMRTLYQGNLTNSGANGNVNKTNAAGLKATNKDNLVTNKKPETIDRSTVGVMAAQMIWAQRAFEQIQMTVSANWSDWSTHVLNIGKVYHIQGGDLSTESAYGHLNSVSLVLSTSGPTATLDLSFTHCRSVELNNERALDANPVYLNTDPY